MAWLLHSRIGIRLVMRGSSATAHFYLLEEQQEEIHEEFGEVLEWDDLPGHNSCRISLYKAGINPSDENDWLQQYEWFTGKLKRFDQVFRERIQALNAADWIQEDEDE